MALWRQTETLCQNLCERIQHNRALLGRVARVGKPSKSRFGAVPVSGQIASGIADDNFFTTFLHASDISRLRFP